MGKIDSVPVIHMEKQIQPMKGEVDLKNLLIEIDKASHRAIMLSGLDKPGK